MTFSKVACWRLDSKSLSNLSNLNRASTMSYIAMCLTFLCVFAYTPPRWQDWNQNSRFNLTRAIVEQRTVRIDAYISNTGDYATVDGHAYSDKAPGLALLAVPVYAITQAVLPYGLDDVALQLGTSNRFAGTLNPGGAGVNDERVQVAIALYIATIVCVVVPAVLMLLLLALLVERLSGSRPAGIGSALIIGLATPVFTYSQAFYGHIPAAVCVVVAVTMIALRPRPRLCNRRLLAVGFLLGTAVLFEFPAAFAAIPVAVWALAIARGRAVGYGLLGAVVPLGTLAIFDLISFGTILPVGYANSTYWPDQYEVGFLTLTYPRWESIWGLSGSEFRGLFFYSPVLLLMLPGIWFGLRDLRQRTATGIALVSFLLMFAFAASSAIWWGGFAVGPRYILAGVPLLALPLGTFIAWLMTQRLSVRAAGLVSVALLGVASAALVWSSTFASQNYPTDETRSPLFDYVLPALRDGDVARNLGMILQLKGVVSIVPLLVIVVIGIVCTFALNLVPRRVTQ